MFRTPWTLALASVLLVANPVSAPAAFFSWTNPSGGEWDVPANWGASRYPSSFFDFARFDVPGAYEVDAADPATARPIAGTEFRRGTVGFTTHDGFRTTIQVGNGLEPATLVLRSGTIEGQTHTVGSNGTLILEAGSGLRSVAGGGYGFEVLQGGFLGGEGSLDGQVLRSFGTVSPGAADGAAGTLVLGQNVPAGLDQRSTGDLVVDVGSDGHDRLQVVSGPVTLDGALTVRLAPGYRPGSGERFEILSAPSIGGAFAQVDLPQELELEAGPASIVLVAVATSIVVPVDVHPGDCPNSFNPVSRGVVPVSIAGSADLDPAAIDPASLTLHGVPPLRWALEDVSAPGGEGCDCTHSGPDGALDLVLKFSAPELALAMGEVAHGDEVVLPLEGALFDGTGLTGEDCVVIRGMGKGAKNRSSGWDAVRGSGPRLLTGPREPVQRIAVSLSEESRLRGTVFDVAGRRIEDVVDGRFPAGLREIRWDAAGRPAGVYFLRLETDRARSSVRVVVHR